MFGPQLRSSAVLTLLRCQEGNEARRNVAGSGGYSGGYEGHLRAHRGETSLRAFDYEVGANSGHFRVGDQASVGFMLASI